MGYSAFDLISFYYNDIKGVYSQILFFVLVLCIWAISNKLCIGVMSVGAVGIILAVADSVMYRSRDELLNFKDLSLLEVADTAGNSFFVNWGTQLAYLVLTICILAIIGAVFDFVWKNDVKLLFKIRFTIGAVLFAISILYGYLGMNKISGMDMHNKIFDSTDNGYAVYRLLERRQYAYNEEKVLNAYEELIVDYKEAEENIKPNVICIMCESWWDLDNAEFADGVELSDDPMEPIRRIADKCKWGYVSVNVYGGGTSASEFECLTGLNSKYCESKSTVFSSLAKLKEAPSCLDYFNGRGYETIAVHPYYGDFYSRDRVYEKMGFDKKIFEESMRYCDIYNKFISDDSFANQLIYEYENRSDDSPLFVWGVTVGNHIEHMNYKYDFDENYNYPINIAVDNQSIENSDEMRRLVSYINGIYYSNLAIEKLIQYFEKVDEPTVIMMYGDHSPMWIDSNVEILGLKNSDRISKTSYNTPVLMWKNYDNYGNNETVVKGEQVGCLMGKVFEYAGLPHCKATSIISNYNKSIKADTIMYTLDYEGNEITEMSAEQVKLIKNMQLIQYDILNGKQYLDNLWR